MFQMNATTIPMMLMYMDQYQTMLILIPEVLVPGLDSTDQGMIAIIR